MKRASERALAHLREDQYAIEADTALRREIEAEEVARAAAARRDSRHNSLIKEIESQIALWDEMGLKTLETFTVTPPKMIPPLGMRLPPPRDLPPTSISPATYGIGAYIKARALPRTPTISDVFTAALPRAVFRRLLESVRNRIARVKTMGELVNTKRTPPPKTPEDIIAVFMTRIFAAVHRIETIKDVYKHPKVRLSFRPRLRLTPSRSLRGCFLSTSFPSGMLQ